MILYASLQEINFTAFMHIGARASVRIQSFIDGLMLALETDCFDDDTLITKVTVMFLLY